jgi:multicomponent K+:H+ antiporter subunit D
MTAGAAPVLILPIVLPLLAGALMLAVERFAPRARNALGLTATGALVVLAACLLREADRGTVDIYLVGNWAAPFGITLVLDRLAALMLLLTAGLALVALVYACSGWVDRSTNFHPFFQFQLAGLNGAFLTGDLFNLFVFFELLLIASYGLLLQRAGGQALRNGFHYVVINLAGSSLFLIAVSLLYGVTGTLNLADLAQRIAGVPDGDRGLVHAALLLLLVVFAIKAAVLPFGFWLPETYRIAPAPVAALFAVMTKVGVYAIIRTTALLSADPGGPGAATAWSANHALFWLGIATIVVGSLGALAAVRLKAMVAFLVVVSAGMLVAAAMFRSTGALGGALYYLVHSTLAGALLFLLVEPIARQRGDAGDRLRSAAAIEQATLLGLVFVVAAVATAGLPPLSGFIGKFLLLEGVYREPLFLQFWAAVLVAGLFATVALARAGSRIFWKIPLLPKPAPAGRVVAGEGLAIGALVVALLLLTTQAAPVARYAASAAGQLRQPAAYVAAVRGARPVAARPEVQSDGLRR